MRAVEPCTHACDLRCEHDSSGRIPSGRRKHSGAAVSLDGGERGSPVWVCAYGDDDKVRPRRSRMARTGMNVRPGSRVLATERVQRWVGAHQRGGVEMVAT
jgi:hypothetical protein